MPVMLWFDGLEGTRIRRLIILMANNNNNNKKRSNLVQYHIKNVNVALSEYTDR